MTIKIKVDVLSLMIFEKEVKGDKIAKLVRDYVKLRYLLEHPEQQSEFFSWGVGSNQKQMFKIENEYNKLKKVIFTMTEEEINDNIKKAETSITKINSMGHIHFLTGMHLVSLRNQIRNYAALQEMKAKYKVLHDIEYYYNNTQELELFFEL